MPVLGVGCGNGETLIRGHGQFEYGLGIDNDAEHLRTAVDSIQEAGITNVAGSACRITNRTLTP
jgi:cyclopropane fatty-acyl-phospholipid synthase-like methyltransferase